jgi:hypothetical protein
MHTGYFLRDDRDAGLSVEEKYSLFRARPIEYYGRVEIFAGFTLEAAIKLADHSIAQDQKDKKDMIQW